MLSLLTAFFLTHGDASWYWWVFWVVFAFMEFLKHIKENQVEQQPIPFVGWVQVDKEDTEDMLRQQLHTLTEENMRLKSVIHDLESKLYGGSVL